MSTTSELGHLAMPINFLAQVKIQMAQASFEPLDPESYALPLRHTDLAIYGGMCHNKTMITTHRILNQPYLPGHQSHCHFLAS